MIRRLDRFCLVSAVLALAALFFKAGGGGHPLGMMSSGVLLGADIAVLGVALVGAFAGVRDHKTGLILIGVVALAQGAALHTLSGAIGGVAALGFWLYIFAVWALAWRGIDRIARYRTLNRVRQRGFDLMAPVFFGLWFLFLWQAGVTGFAVPQVLLPAPGAIAARIVASTGTLWADFYQTFMKAVLAGYLIGCTSGFVTAIAIDRVPFLKRGLLPLGNLASALPIVGVAPIMVMWFGFDWQSKAAVVVIMTFFPMLVNTLSGLDAAGALERDLMRSYAAGYGQNLVKLRLPAALPFMFNALKINSTLALIGAIVAEFFGTPIVGMGFRISTEVGRMNVDMVWAEIAVAALAGSLFYGAIAFLERTVTFWDPALRRSRRR